MGHGNSALLVAPAKSWVSSLTPSVTPASLALPSKNIKNANPSYRIDCCRPGLSGLCTKLLLGVLLCIDTATSDHAEMQVGQCHSSTQSSPTVPHHLLPRFRGVATVPTMVYISPTQVVLLTSPLRSLLPPCPQAGSPPATLFCSSQMHHPALPLEALHWLFLQMKDSLLQKLAWLPASPS